MCRSLPVSSLVFLALSVVPAAGQKVYWVSLAGTPDIRRANLDGTDSEPVVELPAQFLPQWVRVDVSDNRVYWSEINPNRVFRATLTGQQIEIVVDDSLAQGGAMPFDIDPAAGHVYWAEPEPGIIRRTNVDGTGTVTILNTGQSIIYIAFEPTHGRLYWSSPNGINRSELDGSASQVLIAESSSSITFDGPTMYWANRNLDAIRSADLDGVGVTTALPVGPAVTDVAIDGAAQKAYWTETSPVGLVRRANLDGSGYEDLATGQGSVGIDLDLSECSGNGTVAGGICTCDAGWSGDNCDCPLTTCPANCSGNGTCICGACECDPGWTDADCSCSTLCPADCSGNGVCNCGTCVCADGWEGADCACSTDPCPNDCSNNGTCVCGACVCDPGWDGDDCSCLPELCPGDCSGNGTCGCGVCTCDTGWSGEDCSTPTSPQIRLFMARDGEQDAAAITGTTTLQMNAGSTARIMVWLEDTTEPDLPAESYQIIVQYTASPGPGANGTIMYVDNNPGTGGGDTVFVDTMRSDWLYATESVVLPTIYNESPLFDLFGLIYDSFVGEFTDPAALGGIHYICEFEFEASTDAHGMFQLRLLEPIIDPSPATVFFSSNFQIYFIDEHQPLTIFVTDCGDGQIEGLEECDDGNDVSGDGCSADCVIEFCGDGIVNLPGEMCDDGNTSSNDGCSAECIVEFCGDGLINVFEDCDDGNADPADGCSPDCEVEFGYECSAEPSVCLLTAPPVPAQSPIGMMALLAVLSAAVAGITWRARRTI